MPFSLDLLHPDTAATAQAAAAAVRAASRLAAVELGLVLGTGLGALAQAAEDAVTIAYSDLPGFPSSGVSGHAGRLVLGRLAGRRVAIFQGRSHYYEHGHAAAMRVPIE